MAPHGTSKAYIVDRLRREGETALLAAIEAGKITALTAAVELGWVLRPPKRGRNIQRTKRIAHQVRTITGEGFSSGQIMELWLGPNPTGSFFNSPEELRAAWEANRDEVMRQWGSHGRRPQGWWAFDTQLEYPGHSRERSFLCRAGVLSELERIEMEAEWKVEFDEAKGKSASERREHYEHHDIPAELIEVWTQERPRRRGRQKALSEEAAAIK